MTSRPPHDLLQSTTSRTGAADDAPGRIAALQEERRQLQAALRSASRELIQTRAELRALASAFPDLLIRLDQFGTVLECRVGEAASPYAMMTSAVGQRLSDFPHRSIPASIETASGRARQLGTMVSVECALMTHEGERFAEVRVLPLPNGQLIVIVRDISERKRSEEELTRLAFHDTLTGLPNRARFIVRLQEALSQAGTDGRPLAVMFLDLDNFKVVNDSIGHEAGDQLLIAVAERLQTSLRPGDTIARFGGDELAVLVEGLADPGEAVRVAERIRKVLRPPISLSGHEVFVTASVGIAIGTPGEEEPAGLLRKADLAMYRSKAAGKAQYTVYDPSMNAAALERLQLGSDLHLAIERGEMSVMYQPIVTLSTGVIEELEALVRWQHPILGTISPARFIPIAEENGLIVPVGRWVLREACRQLGLWRDAVPDLDDLVISVNLSAKQLNDHELVPAIAQILDESRLDPTCLKLELTESTVMTDVATTAGRLRDLKALGLSLAIDDFGTGYSSLSYLKRLPLDTLKVDRSFVDGLGTDPQDTAIVRTVITLAKSLHLKTTGEGIETAEQADHLRDLGCDRGQGYLFSPPLPPAALGTLLTGGSSGGLRAAG
ncbi:MAG: EAL domain-containing protein [Chloroflexi bacterium]|nr:EAL domain-containing protein [Chloroflexota bacterium]